MLSWGDVSAWKPGPLNAATADLSELRRIAESNGDSLEQAHRLFLFGESRGETLEAARSQLSGAKGDLDRLINDVSELLMATAQAADGVWEVQRRVLECEQFAQLNNISVEASGKVSYSLESVPPSASQYTVDPAQSRNIAKIQAGHELQEMVNDALEYAEQVDADYRARLNAVASGTYRCEETSSSHSPGLADLPQASWSVFAVSSWWNSLSDEERAEIITNHPELIGNLDGIDARSRDLANRRRLLPLRDSLAADVDRIRALYAEAAKSRGSADGPNPYAEQLRIAWAKLADIDETIRQANKHPGYTLLTLDASGSDHLRVAMAIGNVDTADHIATYVPGMSTNPADSLELCLRQASNIEEESVSLNKGTVATVAWLGYDAPAALGDPGWTEVASTRRAETGARLLSSFQEGLHASRAMHASSVPGSASDPHTTILGHSYGSMTSGKAVSRIAPGAVDDLVMFGSPGSGVHDIHEYNLDSGRAYVSAVDSEDWVQGVGPDRTFGTNPTDLKGITHLSSDAPNDPNKWSPIGRHSSYLEEGSGALKDFARVVTGTYE